jgi:hypothetical protein
MFCITLLDLWLQNLFIFFSFFILILCTLFRILCAAGVLSPEVGVFQGPAEPGGPARHIALLCLLHHGGNEGAQFTSNKWSCKLYLEGKVQRETFL